MNDITILIEERIVSSVYKPVRDLLAVKVYFDTTVLHSIQDSRRAIGRSIHEFVRITYID